jgi:hypothetical protein
LSQISLLDFVAVYASLRSSHRTRSGMRSNWGDLPAALWFSIEDIGLIYIWMKRKHDEQLSKAVAAAY